VGNFNDISPLNESYTSGNMVAYYSLIPLVIASFSYGNNDVYQYIFRIGGISLFFVMLSTAKISLNRRYLLKVYISPVAWVILYYVVISVYSASLAVNPLLGYWKSFEVLCVFFYILFIANIRQTNKINDILYIDVFKNVTMIILLTSILLKFIITGVSIDKISGYFPIINPNTVGTLSLILSIIYFYKKSFLLGALFFLIMILSGSKTNIVALMLIFIIFLFHYKKYGYSKWITRLTILTIFGLIMVFIYPVYEEIYLYGGDYEKLSKLSGRLLMWELVNDLSDSGYFYSKIFYGDGIGASRYLYLVTDGINHSVSMHNAWLEIILSAGLVACLWMFGVTLYSGKILFSYVKNRFHMALFLIFIVIFTRSFTSSNLSSIMPEMIFFYIIAQHAFILKKRDRNAKKTRMEKGIKNV
jgi:hypothetical protein